MIQSSALSCYKCGRIPDEILILNCNHNLCLSDAAKRIELTSKLGETNLQTLLCEFCNTPTILDATTANALIPYMNNPPTTEIKRKQPSPIPSIIAEPVEIDYTTQQMCKNHPSEPVQYFCFDCLVPPICSECVVHGIHKTHDVQNIPTSVPIVKGRLQNAIQTMSAKADRLQGSLITINQKQGELGDQNNSIKAQIKSMFDDLRLKLLSKEKELEQLSEQILINSQQDLNLISQQIENRLGIINNNINVINTEGNENIPNRPLNFYALNYPTINQLIEIESRDSFPTSEYLKRFNFAVDPELNAELIRKSQEISDLIYSMRHPIARWATGQFIVKNVP